MSHNYYEGILQLRNPSEEILDFVRKQVMEKDSISIAKEEPVKNGVDIYISSQHFLQNLGRKLQKEFGGELIISNRLHTQSKETSRQLYRVNVLFRMPEFKKGDVIRFKGREVKVLNVGKKVYGAFAGTGRKVQINYKDL